MTLRLEEATPPGMVRSRAQCDADTAGPSVTSTPRGRILCLTSNFPRWPGDSTTPFVLHLAQDMQELGWDVDVVAPHAPGAARNEVMDGIAVERFRYLWPTSSQTVCYEGGAIGNLRRRPSNYLKLPALVAAETAAVVARVRRRHYDIVHSHWLLPQGFAGGIASTLGGVPQVTTVHGSDVLALRARWLRPFKRSALRRSALITVNSSITEAAVRHIEGFTTPVVRIPMGVDTTKIDSDARIVRELRSRYRRGDGPLVVFVGRVVEEKGVSDLIDAVELLLPELPNTSAVIVGDGSAKSNLERSVTARSLGEHIKFAGWVDSHHVPNYLRAADVFVGPSRMSASGGREAQGLTFLEAMASETPVVATRSGGIVDFIADGETGLLVSEASPREIAQTVRRLVHSPHFAQGLAAAGRQRVVDGFSRQATAAAFDRQFTSLRSSRRHWHQ